MKTELNDKLVAAAMCATTVVNRMYRYKDIEHLRESLGVALIAFAKAFAEDENEDMWDSTFKMVDDIDQSSDDDLLDIAEAFIEVNEDVMLDICRRHMDK